LKEKVTPPLERRRSLLKTGPASERKERGPLSVCGKTRIAREEKGGMILPLTRGEKEKPYHYRERKKEGDPSPFLSRKKEKNEEMSYYKYLPLEAR